MRLDIDGVRKKRECANSEVFKEFVMTVLASTRVFCRKSELNFDFCLYLTLVL